MAKDRDEYRVVFAIYDFDCKAEDITELLGITPSRVELKGEEKIVGQSEQKVTRRLAHSAWILESPVSNSSLEEVLNAVLNKLGAARQQVRELAERYEAEISLVAYCQSANIGFHVKAEHIKELAAMKVELDVDLYYIGD